MKPGMSYLSGKEIELVHTSALRILSELGMRMPSPEALDLLAGAGAAIKDGDIARIPPPLVERAVEQVPKREAVILFARDPVHDVRFTSHDPAAAAMTMATHVIDPHTGRRRPATTGDLANLTRLVDRMPNVRVNGGLVTPQEVPGQINDWVTWAVTLEHTTKHITGGMYGARCVHDAARMAALAGGGESAFRQRPSISGWVLTLPPLGIDRESLEALMAMSRLGIPAVVSSGPILGTTSPVTLAGTIAQAHAEILGCLVVSQLAGPGAPFIYTSFARGMDMKAGTVSMACPEFGILKVAMAQLGRFLGLPVRMPGMLRDAKVLDAQAGFETGLTGVLAALSADLIDAMQLDADLLVDFADPIFCDECMGALRRLARPLVVNEETLALGALADVGHGGSFLAHDHTFAHFRDELWEPRLMERRNREVWQREGARDARARALERALALLEQSPAVELSARARAGIDEIVERARADYVDPEIA